MVTFLFAVLLNVSFAANVNLLDLSDVSVLLPLPTVESWDQLPKGETKAAFGELLPKKYFLKIPQLIGIPTNEMLFVDLRVVGLRIDPCFHEGPAPVKCKTQIRFVWQPLENVNGVTSTMDASLHVFYDLSETEFKELISGLSELKSTKSQSALNQPLTVNPFLKAEGLDGDYAKKFFGLIYNYVGVEKLSRITFMQLFMNKVVWDFGGFDIADGEFTPIEIPRVRSRIQRFVNQATKPAPIWFFGNIVPAPVDPENVNILVRDSRVLGPQDEAEIIEAVRSAYRFENPLQHNPGTVDCVSCHVAQSARWWANRQYPWYNLPQILKADIYESQERNLANVSPMQPHTNIMRAFGYFFNQPIVSQRTINESAEVLKYLNAAGAK